MVALSGGTTKRVVAARQYEASYVPGVRAESVGAVELVPSPFPSSSVDDIVEPFDTMIQIEMGSSITATTTIPTTADTTVATRTATGATPGEGGVTGLAEARLTEAGEVAGSTTTGLSKPAKIGIGVSAVLFALMAGILVFWGLRRRRERRPAGVKGKGRIDPTMIGPPKPILTPPDSPTTTTGTNLTGARPGTVTSSTSSRHSSRSRREEESRSCDHSDPQSHSPTPNFSPDTHPSAGMFPVPIILSNRSPSPSQPPPSPLFSNPHTGITSQNHDPHLKASTDTETPIRPPIAPPPKSLKRPTSMIIPTTTTRPGVLLSPFSLPSPSFPGGYRSVSEGAQTGNEMTTPAVPQKSSRRRSRLLEPEGSAVDDKNGDRTRPATAPDMDVSGTGHDEGDRGGDLDGADEGLKPLPLFSSPSPSPSPLVDSGRGDRVLRSGSRAGRGVVDGSHSVLEEEVQAPEVPAKNTARASMVSMVSSG